MKSLMMITLAASFPLFLVREAKADPIEPSCELEVTWGTPPFSENIGFQMDPQTNQFINITLNSIPLNYSGGRYLGNDATIYVGCVDGPCPIFTFNPVTGKVISINIEGGSQVIDSSQLTCSSPLTPPICSVYVNYLYQTILDRDPDQTGDTYWVNECTSGAVSRDQIMADFYQSPEFVSKFTPNEDICNADIVQFYELFLNREPDPNGELFWFKQCMQGPSQLGIIAQDFITSPEYKALHQTTSTVQSSEGGASSSLASSASTPSISKLTLDMGAAPDKSYVAITSAQGQGILNTMGKAAQTGIPVNPNSADLASHSVAAQ